MWSYQSSKILREARNLDFYVQSPGIFFFMLADKSKLSKTLFGATICGPKQILLWATTVPWAAQLGHLIYVEIHR